MKRTKGSLSEQLHQSFEKKGLNLICAQIEFKVFIENFVEASKQILYDIVTIDDSDGENDDLKDYLKTCSRLKNCCEKERNKKDSFLALKEIFSFATSK